MIRELVFHLGDRKTGSTSIQAALRSGRWEAEGAPRLCYPARLHNGAIATSLTGMNPVETSKRPFRNLVARLSSTDDADIAVISSEHFEVVPPNNLKQALETHLPNYAGTARFVLYLRPHADRILSSYAERTKLGVFSGSLAEFVDAAIEDGKYRYLDRVRRWKRIFGDRFVVRPMIRAALHQNCVVRDFLSIALKSENVKLLDEPAANESLTIRDLAILTLLHREYPGLAANDKSRQVIGRNLGLICAANSGTEIARPTYNHELCEKVIAAHRDDAIMIDREFFEGTPMLDALEAVRGKATETVPSLQPEDNFSPGALRDLKVLIKLIWRMAEINMEGWSEFFTKARLDEEGSDHPFKAIVEPSARKQAAVDANRPKAQALSEQRRKERLNRLSET